MHYAIHLTVHRDTVRWLVMFIELLIKLLESGLTAFSIHTNVIKIMIPKMADTSKDGLLLGRRISHLTAI